ncbi:MAG: hypothetical protein NTZ78_14900 [Candidatus Aureabacteria bacterium]|nr:hypothetical protein [Candidatus Auribacterota bacterium]
MRFPCNHSYPVGQFEVINPALICVLGRHAAQMLLKTEEGINRLRGRFHDYHGIKIIPTYHAENDKVKDDLRKLRVFLDESS